MNVINLSWELVILAESLSWFQARLKNKIALACVWHCCCLASQQTRSVRAAWNSARLQPSHYQRLVGASPYVRQHHTVNFVSWHWKSHVNSSEIIWTISAPKFSTVFDGKKFYFVFLNRESWEVFIANFILINFKRLNQIRKFLNDFGKFGDRFKLSLDDFDVKWKD